MYNHTDINLKPIADYGANKILYTRGSLLGYINTGNPYDKRYYRTNIPCDKFENRSCKKSIKKPLVIAGAVLALGAGICAWLKKKGKVDFKFVSDIGNKVKNFFTKKS